MVVMVPKQRPQQPVSVVVVVAVSVSVMMILSLHHYRRLRLHIDGSRLHIGGLRLHVHLRRRRGVHWRVGRRLVCRARQQRTATHKRYSQ